MIKGAPGQDPEAFKLLPMVRPRPASPACSGSGCERASRSALHTPPCRAAPACAGKAMQAHTGPVTHCRCGSAGHPTSQSLNWPRCQSIAWHGKLAGHDGACWSEEEGHVAADKGHHPRPRSCRTCTPTVLLRDPRLAKGAWATGNQGTRTALGPRAGGHRGGSSPMHHPLPPAPQEQ